MELGITLGQKLAMTQQMLLSVKILQMSSLDLKNYIVSEALENPLLEFDFLPQGQNTNSALPKKEWQTPIYESRTGETLKEFLSFQLVDFDVSGEVRRAAYYIIESLDENGYLSVPRQQILKELGCDKWVFADALNTIHQMEPYGVGASNLQECLLIQVRCLKISNCVLSSLIEKYLEGLTKKPLNKLASEMGVNFEELKKAKDVLLALNPKPGNGFSGPKAVPYIQPDLFILPAEGGFQVMYNDFALPKIELSNFYQHFMKSADSDTLAYIRNKTTEVKLLISSINQRRETVISCTKAILSRQWLFFDKGPGHLVPMTLSDIADDLGLHKSTISRAVSGKYLQSEWGTKRLSDFFSNAVSKSSEFKSRDMAVVQIKRIINNEDKRMPLSDQKIASLLGNAGITISRRTVAKYREIAKIPPAAGRKMF